MEWKVKYSISTPSTYMFRGEELTSLKAHILLEATPEGKIEDTMQIVVHSEEHNLHSMGRHCKTGCKKQRLPLQKWRRIQPRNSSWV
jgi:hypothetical protein